MPIRQKDRLKELFKRIDTGKLPFKLAEKDLHSLGLDIAEDLKATLLDLNKNDSLKWCFSTVKKAKIFLIIYQANEMSESIYKEIIAKKLPEYSYKTIATIVDEGISKGFYIPLDPYDKSISDKKIKNLRPSIEVLTSFYNWNFSRVSAMTNIIKKFK
jgi:hypothetical protein|tara:strand:+ start:1387 stop:1860 length:474 start_codon:yes stop_codon:yes gene_type:complete